MTLLRLITWPYVRKHLLRSVLTTVGIVLGVALLVGMQTANQSVLHGFNDTVDRIAGKAQLQVSAADIGFPEEILERVQAVPEVRAAAPVIESSVDSGIRGEARLLILAVDMTGDRSLRDYDFESGDEDVIDDPLVFLAQPDSLIVTREFAARNGLHTGSSVEFETMVGRKRFTIRGILKTGGMTSAFGGNLGIMDIYAAQKIFGRGRHFDRIDIGLQEGVSVDRGEQALRRALGPGFTIEPPSGRGRHFESLLAIYTLAAGISSLFALFIGMFIIYNSFAIAVTQRRPEIGILRALGATRAQIRTLFLAESAVAGLIGSATGVALGLAVARSIAMATSETLQGIFGVAQYTSERVIDPLLLVGAMAAGVATSILAALIPARNAARVEPVQALQKGKYQVLGAGENRARRWAALATALLAIVCLAFSRYRPIFFLGCALVVTSFLLLAPFLSLELSRLLRRPLKWLRPVEGSLAADSLIQAPRRTSATVAALMLSLALIIGQAGVARGSFQSMEEWADTTLNPDLFVSTSESISAREFHFPASMQRDLEAVPGIDEVQPVRFARLEFRKLPIMVLAVEEAKVERRVPRHIIEGDRSTMARLAAEGKGLIVSENLAALRHLRLGDPVELPTPSGILRLPIVGVIRDFSNQLGSIYLDRSVYTRAFMDDAVDVFRVCLKPGVPPVEARKRIVERLASQQRLFVLLNADVREYIDRLVNQWFGLTYIQLGVAVIVAILGIVNALTVSIADRRRELGVLRAVGGLRTQIRQTIWLEAMAIGIIGLVLGVAAGAVFLYYELQVIQVDLTGFPLNYEFPVDIALLLIPVILGAAFGSALLPAETAVRSSLVEALEYE
ncbi:MAG TPA: FtsX-like permease family protein [Bryobacteraceae bacterium]